jgi:hypothetical protein
LFVLGTHRAPNRKKIQPSVQIQTTTRRKNKNEEGRKVWLRKREENHPEEHGFSNRHVSTTIIPPLTIAFLIQNIKSAAANSNLLTLALGRHLDDIRGLNLPFIL